MADPLSRMKAGRRNPGFSSIQELKSSLHSQSNAHSVVFPPNHFLSQNSTGASSTLATVQSAVPYHTNFSHFNPSPMPSLPKAASEMVNDPVASGRPDTTTLAAADFDIDVRTGFLPPKPPIEDLRQELGGGTETMAWTLWEELVRRAKKECFLRPSNGPKKDEDQEEDTNATWEERRKVSSSWKRAVRNMLTTDADMEMIRNDVRRLRRAYVVLSFIQHFYVHTIDENTELDPNAQVAEPQLVVPLSVGKPFWEISGRLGLPPVLTFAATVLWNWKFKDPSRGYTYDNFRILNTFTRPSSIPSQHTSEDWFYVTSLHVELHGALLLSHLRLVLQESFLSDSISQDRLSTSLGEITQLINQLTKRMAADVQGVDPHEFYWEIRRWFMGGKWIFQGLGDNGEDVQMEIGGPSAGQSTLVHALDLVLGIDHRPRDDQESPRGARQFADREDQTTGQDQTFESSASEGEDEALVREQRLRVKKAMSTHDRTFMARMAHYMPYHHRQFLVHLSTPDQELGQKTLRQMALEDAEDGGVRKGYNAAMEQMKLFRDEHIRIVARFIVAQARRTALTSVEKSREPVRREKMKGTGGTDLIRFLKTCRERTVEGLIQSEEQ